MPCLHCLAEKTNRGGKFCGQQCAKNYRVFRLCQDCKCPIECQAVGRPKRRCRKCTSRKQRNTASSKLRQNHRKRCRLYGVPYSSQVTSQAVFEKDSYRCHICKRQTLKVFKFVNGRPHPQSPTIDHHPYPLSAGVLGHEWDNVRCACWLCNVRKSSKWSGQHLLFK